MAVERANAFQFKGSVTLVGPELKVGDTAPAFKAVANDFSTVESSAYAGKVKIISSVPSLDTGTCSTQTRTFNQEAAGLKENIVILTISRDLPFAQKRWCGAEGVDKVVVLSDWLYSSFAPAYGTYIKEWNLCSRAVFVVDSSDKIVHVEYVPSGGQEPNYGAAIEAAKAAK